MSEANRKHQFEGFDVSQTLEYLSKPVMVSDSDHIIRIVNRSARDMLRRVEADLRTDLPNFRADELVGKSIDVFHKNPAYQHEILRGMREPHAAKFTIGGVKMAFNATPILRADGSLDSVFVEWDDISHVAIAALQSAINDMAEAHMDGQIRARIDENLFDGELQETARNVNKMVAGHINTKKRVLATIDGFAKGDFDTEIPQFDDERAFITKGLTKVRDKFRLVVGEIAELSDAMVAGRLDREVDKTGFEGEYLGIIESLDRAFASLNRVFTEISAQVDQVGQTVSQMNEASNALAENSQITSASVDQVSASAEETDSQVKANAEAASRADKLVNAASKVTEAGSEKVGAMVAAMQDINSSSADIAKIIKVIDEIAFQTNLLALNAAVEAARAGQHGRGFAVVAQEVRNLAGRSAKAARETSDLIENATDRVGVGVRLASETSEAFDRIAQDIEKVKSLVRDINSASEEQSRGVEQINQAIGDVARTALSTSQQADELSATAAEMTAATKAMTTEIRKFRLREITMADPGGMPDLAALPPELMRQIQALMHGAAVPSAKPNGHANGHANGAAKAAARAGDHDERGYEMF
ncbi:methyl-accepting chemotaxis protein [Meridianimarinicoccus sp. RP-17]|uniref:methyl-accepting chemotaxis protein n=1 Tax=Meridianimarinicoccus zhengii TaxID=2056810 RepID=UPI0013A6F490|nr:methyl-accepting chemotaxis protein [Phycocomes zhengii]